MGVNMTNNTDEFFRYKCDYCRTEVIVDRLNTVEAKCYLCGCPLTKIERISSKDILDTLLSFKVSQQEAEIIIKDFKCIIVIFISVRGDKYFIII